MSKIRGLDIGATVGRMRQGVTGEGIFGPERWKEATVQGLIKWAYFQQWWQQFISNIKRDPRLPVMLRPVAVAMFQKRAFDVIIGALTRLGHVVVEDCLALAAAGVLPAPGAQV